MKKINLYNRFHKNTKFHKRVINKRNYTYSLILKVISKYIKNSHSVLDIGCGSGAISLFIASTYPTNVIGIDISTKAIKECIKSAKYLGLKNASYNVATFPTFNTSKKFDLILCFEVLEHLSDDKKAIKKIYDLLSKGGIAIISTPSLNAPLYRLGYATKFDERVGHLRRYSVDSLTQLVNLQKFSILEVVKVEGLLRNFLYLNSLAGGILRFIKYPVTILFEHLDNIFLKIFKESDIFIIIKK